MEGLIPMVYKSIKKNNARSNYSFLNSGPAQNYNIADSYLHRYGNVEYLGRGTPSLTTQSDQVSSFGGSHHRRYNSMIVGRASDGVGEINNKPNDDDDNKQVVKFRHHRFFSCFAGV